MSKGAAIVLALLVAGCGEVKKPSRTSTTGEGVDTAASASPSVPFPHPDNWGEITEHGLWVLRFEAAPCLRCHQSASDQPVVPPACNACHRNYPHPPDWVRAQAHGAFVMREGRSTCATECHGTDLEGGLSEISCNLCHSVYPHPAGWVAPAAHGETAQGDGRRICQGCHGTDDAGGRSGVSCFSCHERYPHALDWAAMHGGFVRENGLTGCTTLCHGNDLRGGLSEIACNRCHHLYQPRVGAEAVEIHPGDCQTCHGSEWDWFAPDQCRSCHSIFPHPEAQAWTQVQEGEEVCTEIEEDWWECSREQFVSPHAREFLDEEEVCTSCHGDNFEGGLAAPACFSCHAGYPHVPGWVTETGGGHTQTYLGGTLGYGSNCTLCHIRFGRGVEDIAPACSLCHADYPHLHSPDVAEAEDWLRARRHGRGFILSEIWESAGRENDCQTCHGEDLRGMGNPAKDCLSCHLAVSHEGCCRVSGRMPPGSWRNPSNHGRAFLQIRLEGREACTSCHSRINRLPDTVCNPFRAEFRSSALTDCSACHTLPPDPPGPAGPCPPDGCAATGGDCP